MYLRCTKQVNAGYIVHFLAMYLRCTGSVHHPLPPVRVWVVVLWPNGVREVRKSEVERRKLNGGDVEGRYAYNDESNNDNDSEELDDNSDDDDEISDNEGDGDDNDNDDNEDEDDGDGDNDSENEYDGDYGHSGDLYDGESPGPEREH